VSKNSLLKLAGSGPADRLTGSGYCFKSLMSFEVCRLFNAVRLCELRFFRSHSSSLLRDSVSSVVSMLRRVARGESVDDCPFEVDGSMIGLARAFSRVLAASCESC